MGLLPLGLALQPVNRVLSHPMNLTQLTSADLKHIVKLPEPPRQFCANMR